MIRRLCEIGKRFPSAILLPHTPIKELFDGGMSPSPYQAGLLEKGYLT